MIDLPAISVIEIESIATGIYLSDQVLKSSPVSILRSGTIHDGKYLLLFGGSVASVEFAYNKLRDEGSEEIRDSVFIPNIHKRVIESINREKRNLSGDCVAVFETTSVPAVIKSADSGIKNADVEITEMMIADDVGGKGVVLFSGKLNEVQAALSAARAGITDIAFFQKSKNKFPG